MAAGLPAGISPRMGKLWILCLTILLTGEGIGGADGATLSGSSGGSFNVSFLIASWRISPILIPHQTYHSLNLSLGPFVSPSVNTVLQDSHQQIASSAWLFPHAKQPRIHDATPSQ